MSGGRRDTKENIISSALTLFGQTHDIRKVSLEAIAKTAGVSPTTIYNVFGNRENLVFETVRALVQRSLETNRQTVQLSLPFPQKLAAILSRKQDLLVQYNAELLEKIMSQDESIKPFMDKIYSQEIKPMLAAILNEGREQGYISPEMDQNALLLYLDIIRAGFNSRPDLSGEIIRNPELVQSLSKIIFYGFIHKDAVLFKEK
ncbi:MAG TPA: TetR/AcrR family transcriptional regulator [Dehalococcoidales bacterium]|nr:TetR/AcrR family transcriptional regulator [Dehalococcoidales bacterium]